ncbi:MAG: O-antigen ligase family protein [Deltaproteobacteria bacterium]|nr:O-antigen ligase family protein [Deltaproteobacteria bacterium]
MIFSWLQHLGLTIRGSPLQRSHERLKMWSVAWEESIQDNLWLGNGYGTWLREFSHLPNSGGVSFDTAHNLWIQLIFELGVIHVVVMAIILGLIVWSTLVYKNVEQISLKIGGLFLIIGFFVASVGQEIDYIMPVYIQFAVFAGLCFGGRSFEETDAKGKVTHNQRAWSLIGISFLLVIGAFYYASSISWGGSTFEATQMAFNRWFRPIGAIVATPDRRGREYSLYWSEHGQFNKESFTTLGTTFPEMWIQGNALYLKNGTKWKPRQYQYESQKNIYHSQRLVSFGLHQPHGQTNIILLAENGMYSWEFAGFGEDGTQVGKWCKQSCRLLLYSPNGKDQPHGVRLQMPHAELDENRPAHLVVTMLSIRGEISSFLSDEATQTILNAPFPEGSANKEFVFRNSGDVHHLPVDFRQHQLWLISLKANQVFIPKGHDANSTDNRKLGARVLF